MAFQHHVGPASQSQSLSLSLPETSRDLYTPLETPRSSSLLGNTIAAARPPAGRRVRDEFLGDEAPSSLEPMSTPVDAGRAGGPAGARAPLPCAPPRPLKRHRDEFVFAGNTVPMHQQQQQSQMFASQSLLPDMSQDTLALFPRIIQTHVRKQRPSGIAKAALISSLNRATALHNPFVKPGAPAAARKSVGTPMETPETAVKRPPNSQVTPRLSIVPPPSATLGMGLEDSDPIMSDAAAQPAPPESPREGERDILKKLVVSASQPRKFSLDFEEISVAGEGDFSQVIKARARIDGVVYAVKRNKKPFTFDKMKLDALGEVFALAALQDHPGVLRYHGAWLEQRGEVLYIQTSLMSGGNVYAKYVAQGRRMPVEKLLKLARDIGGALALMQTRGVLHNDVKPDNIFEEVGEKDGARFVIGDFGLASAVDSQATMEGDSRYLCPEALSGNFGGADPCLHNSSSDVGAMSDAEMLSRSPPPKRPRADCPLRTAADIFSFGASLYELATADPIPRNGGTWTKLRTEAERAAQDVFDATGSRALGDIVHKCLAPDPSRRATSAAIMEMLDSPDGSKSEVLRLRAELERVRKTNEELRKCMKEVLNTGVKIPQSTVSRHRKRAEKGEYGSQKTPHKTPHKTPRRNVLVEKNR